MAKILFINPVVREEDNPRHVPYGIALLAAIAMEKGHQVQVFDQNAWRVGSETIDNVLKADNWDVIGLGGITTAYNSIKSIVKQVQAICPKSNIVLGGGVLTSIPREIMGFLPEVKIGVIGEAFNTLPEILKMIDAKENNWSAIDGIIFRDKENQLIVTKQRDLVENLDLLPYPAWELFPLEEIYFKNSQLIFSEEGMTTKRRLDINASFGCSLICRYCYHLGLAGDMRYSSDETGERNVAFDEPGQYTRTNRYHSPEYIVKMVKFLREKYNVDFISFLDENLMTMDQYSGRTWIKEICRLWIENGLQPTCIRDKVPHDETCSGVHWAGTSHATLCNQEVLKTMRNAGCSHLIYGYESFSPEVMKSIGKGATPETNIRSFFWTLKAGIRPIPNQIFGIPNEGFKAIYDNIEAWERLGIMVKPHFATPYPGSEWFTVYRSWIEEQYDGSLENFVMDLGDCTSVSAVISHNFNAVELLGLRELMISRDIKRIKEYEKIWRRARGLSENEPLTIYDENNISQNYKTFWMKTPQII